VESRKTFPVELRPSGLYLPQLDLYLDPDGPVERAFVSHAHANRFEASGTLFASRETLLLMGGRTPDPPKATTPLEWSKPLDWPVARGTETMRLSIEPAGHILGAAQLVVDHRGGRFVYTGDYRSGPGLTHASGAPVRCDELLIESTFGLPIFRFPPRGPTLASIVEFCRATLDQGQTPVVLANALGVAQEVAAALLASGLPVHAQDAVWKMCEAYEALGVSVGIRDGTMDLYDGGAKGARVILAPPSAQRAVRKVRGARLALVSGKALLDAVVEQHRADAAFVLSDHADHDDLVATARASGARSVTTSFGEAAALASILSATGIGATAIDHAPHDDARVP
jgi:DNA ligase-1